MSIEVIVERQRLASHVAAILEQAFPMPVAAGEVAALMQPTPAPVSLVADTLGQLVAAGLATTGDGLDRQRRWLWSPSGAARAQERRLR